eukprot:431145_1
MLLIVSLFLISINHAQNCGPSEYECEGDGLCISILWMCDGIADCLVNGEDEVHDVCGLPCDTTQPTPEVTYSPWTTYSPWSSTNYFWDTSERSESEHIFTMEYIFAME